MRQARQERGCEKRGVTHLVGGAFAPLLRHVLVSALFLSFPMRAPAQMQMPEHHHGGKEPTKQPATKQPPPASGPTRHQHAMQQPTDEHAMHHHEMGMHHMFPALLGSYEASQ